MDIDVEQQTLDNNSVIKLFVITIHHYFPITLTYLLLKPPNIFLILNNNIDKIPQRTDHKFLISYKLFINFDGIDTGIE